LSQRLDNTNPDDLPPEEQFNDVTDRRLLKKNKDNKHSTTNLIRVRTKDNRRPNQRKFIAEKGMNA